MSFQTLTIASEGGETEASLVPAVNLVCCSLMHRGTERLAQRRGLDAYAEQGKTIGIPLLYPWANRLERFGYEAAGKRVTLRRGDRRIPLDGQALPIHGVLPSLLRWEVVGQARAAIEARLDWSSPDLLELFPYRHQVRSEVRIGDGELAIATTVQASGAEAVPVSFGYHPYLRIGSAARDTWEVELGARRRLVLDSRGIPTGEREPGPEQPMRLGADSWDAPFDDIESPARFQVVAGQVEMGVTFRSGYHFAQLFAPAGEEFLAFEPMSATTNALNSGDGLRILAPGEEFRAEFAVSVADRRVSPPPRAPNRRR